MKASEPDECLSSEPFEATRRRLDEVIAAAGMTICAQIDHASACTGRWLRDGQDGRAIASFYPGVLARQACGVPYVMAMKLDSGQRILFEALN